MASPEEFAYEDVQVAGSPVLCSFCMDFLEIMANENLMFKLVFSEKRPAKSISI
jgi:hypothetical protein